MHNSEAYLGCGGLDQLTVSELRHGDKLLSLLAAKLHALDPRQMQSQILEERVRFIMDLLRETLANRYQALSISAFAHILVALDYFLKVHDALPDTHPDGYADDFARIDQVLKDFKPEMDAFKHWKARQPKGAVS
jgi:uncharacterized membrane protein YkvA (DUF1232 family)